MPIKSTKIKLRYKLAYNVFGETLFTLQYRRKTSVIKSIRLVQRRLLSEAQFKAKMFTLNESYFSTGSTKTNL